MYVFGHDDVAIHAEVIATPHPLQRSLEELTSGRSQQALLAPIAGKRSQSGSVRIVADAAGLKAPRSAYT
jgi:hypothetical protein